MRHAAAFFALALLAWTLSGAAAAAGFPTQTIYAGDQSGLDGPGGGLVRNASEMAALTQKIYAGMLAPAPPDINFSDHVVVYYALGTADRPATRVVVKSAELHRGVLAVDVEIASSDSSCLGQSSLTAPFAVALVPIPAADVSSAEFDVRHTSYPCR